MRPSLKYWIFLLAIVNLIFGVILASVLGSWFSLELEEQLYVQALAEKLLPFPLLGAVVLVMAIGSLVSLLFHYYIIPILQLAEKTRLISSVNPEYRIKPRGAKELIYLTEVINESAEAFLRLQTEVDLKIRSARADLTEERNRLAALMSELPGGVVVCNTDGQILLYNPQAQQLLSPVERSGYAESQPGGLIGLGRSVFGILDRDPIVHGLEMLQQAVEKGQSKPVSGFMTALHGGRCLRVSMAPVFGTRDERRQISGFVLSVEDMTRQIEADTRRDMLIQSLTDDLQTAIGEIRESISTILTDPELKPEQLRLYRLNIDRASRSLQQHLAQARENYARHLQALSRVEDVLAENLLQIIQRNITARFAIEVDCQAEEGLWLKLDSYSIVQAISHLGGLLKPQQNLVKMQLRLSRCAPGKAALTISWPGCEVSRQLLGNWENSPLITNVQGQILSFCEVVAKHGGSLGIEPPGGVSCHQVRIELPAPAPEEERIELRAPAGQRPIYYEFDLFHQPGWQKLGPQSLRKLAYLVFDTETTGLNPSEGDEIIQIGAIRIVNNRLLHHETIDQLVDPRRPVPAQSVAIHGIQPELLVGQPTIDQVLPRFHQFAEGSVLVAHNAAFDMKFLQLKQEQAGVRFDQPVLDTLLLSSVIHPNLESHSLDGIAERLNVKIVGRHTALGDAIVTAEVLLKLIPLLEAKGIRTLEDAVRASAASQFAKMKF
ncbi:DNA polymerase III subunit epsilon [Desulfuromonas versatilis]|uniref:DNA polymerase III subunit epsilon n=1 Tax=Desulfuromonas versatilis TaxID=2802975 RepID=A0ABN6DXD0_9BACT|nr:exonuclease domain-containing protein [Desulfuromonas versatilis]BCR03874.1 DNA polymerase III subunit epsilon [Desulfuromonas versatilis]